MIMRCGCAIPHLWSEGHREGSGRLARVRRVDPLVCPWSKVACTPGQAVRRDDVTGQMNSTSSLTTTTITYPGAIGEQSTSLFIKLQLLRGPQPKSYSKDQLIFEFLAQHTALVSAIRCCWPTYPSCNRLQLDQYRWPG